MVGQKQLTANLRRMLPKAVFWSAAALLAAVGPVSGQDPEPLHDNDVVIDSLIIRNSDYISYKNEYHILKYRFRRLDGSEDYSTVYEHIFFQKLADQDRSHVGARVDGVGEVSFLTRYYGKRQIDHNSAVIHDGLQEQELPLAAKHSKRREKGIYREVTTYRDQDGGALTTLVLSSPVFCRLLGKKSHTFQLSDSNRLGLQESFRLQHLLRLIYLYETHRTPLRPGSTKVAQRPDTDSSDSGFTLDFDGFYLNLGLNIAKADPPRDGFGLFNGITFLFKIHNGFYLQPELLLLQKRSHLFEVRSVSVWYIENPLFLRKSFAAGTDEVYFFGGVVNSFAIHSSFDGDKPDSRVHPNNSIPLKLEKERFTVGVSLGGGFTLAEHLNLEVRFTRGTFRIKTKDNEYNSGGYLYNTLEAEKKGPLWSILLGYDLFW